MNAHMAFIELRLKNGLDGNINKEKPAICGYSFILKIYWSLSQSSKACRAALAPRAKTEKQPTA